MKITSQQFIQASAEPADVRKGMGKDNRSATGLDALFPGKSMWGRSDCMNTQILMMSSDKKRLIITIMILF